MLQWSQRGIYCPKGDFYIDPWAPVARAVITHAHADHARSGCGQYLAARPGGSILKHRLGQDIRLQQLDYGETLTHNGVQLSLHPAGHILGSAQVRVEANGQVWVVSGDYKRAADATCAPFEPIACHTFVTESTFGLPIFKWHPQALVLDDINRWWQTNRERGLTSIVFAYALGKAQRILAGLNPTIGAIFCHGAVENINTHYRRQGIALPQTRHVGAVEKKTDFEGALVLAPPSANSGSWTGRFVRPARAFASGWMQIRGNRRRRAVERGFVLSDHCDWDELNQAIIETGAQKIWVTHGYRAEFVRWLRHRGLDAQTMPAQFSDQGAS